MTARFVAVIAASFAAYAVLVLSSLSLRPAEDDEAAPGRRMLRGSPAAGVVAAASGAQFGGTVRRAHGGAAPGHAQAARLALQPASATPAESVRKVAVGARRDL
jgi:hypothetical protein